MSSFYEAGRVLSEVIAGLYLAVTSLGFFSWAFLDPERSARDLGIVFGWPLVLLARLWHGPFRDDG